MIKVKVYVTFISHCRSKALCTVYFSHLAAHISSNLPYFDDLKWATGSHVLRFSLTCFSSFSTCLHKLSPQHGVIKPLKWQIATEHKNFGQKKYSTKILSSNL